MNRDVCTAGGESGCCTTPCLLAAACLASAFLTSHDSMSGCTAFIFAGTSFRNSAQLSFEAVHLRRRASQNQSPSPNRPLGTWDGARCNVPPSLFGPLAAGELLSAPVPSVVTVTDGSRAPGPYAAEGS